MGGGSMTAGALILHCACMDPLSLISSIKHAERFAKHPLGVLLGASWEARESSSGPLQSSGTALGGFQEASGTKDNSMNDFWATFEKS